MPGSAPPAAPGRRRPDPGRDAAARQRGRPRTGAVLLAAGLLTGPGALPARPAPATVVPTAAAATSPAATPRPASARGPATVHAPGLAGPRPRPAPAADPRHPVAAPAPGHPPDPAQQAAAWMLQVSAPTLDGRRLNALRSSGFLWPDALCPGRYALTVRHGVNRLLPPQAPGEAPLPSFDPPLGARVQLQGGLRDGDDPPPPQGATVIAVGDILGSHRDWALLRLDEPLPEAPPPGVLAGQRPRPGQALLSLGLPEDLGPGPDPQRPRLAAEAGCRAGARDGPYGGWRSSCRGAPGQSGGPVYLDTGPAPSAAPGPADAGAGVAAPAGVPASAAAAAAAESDAVPPALGPWRLGGMVVGLQLGPAGGSRAGDAVFLSLADIAPALAEALARDRAAQPCTPGEPPPPRPVDPGGS